MQKQITMSKDEKVVWSLNKDNTQKPLQINTIPVKKSFSERHKTLSYLLVGLLFSLGFGFLILPTETSIDTCFSANYCINTLENPVLYGLYIGLVTFLVLLTIVLLYEMIVKLSQKNNHLTVFSVLFILIAIVSIAIWYFSNDALDRARTKMLPVITTFISLSGLLLIQFRKRK